MPEVAFHRVVIHLVVGHGGLQERVPIHEPLAAEDQPIFEHFEKRVPDRAGTNFIEREPRAPPIATEAHLPELLQDAGFVFVFPFPNAFDQSFTAQLVAIEIFFFLQPPLDHRLRGDAGVICAGHPERVITLHPFETNDDVLQRVIERVAQVQRAGDVGRRDDDGEGFALSPR